MIRQMTQFLMDWAQTVPLEWFTFAGSFVEEIVAPIPSPLVMTLTGSIAAAQSRPLEALLLLSIIGAAGKTCGAWIVYVIADKAEDLVFKRLGKFIGISHEEVVRLGKRFSGSPKDYLLMFVLRALPVMSTALVSVGSGVIRIRPRVYLVGTFLGTIVRDFFYLYVGWSGVEAYHRWVTGFDSVESILQAVMGGTIVCVFAGIVLYRHMRSHGKRRQSEETEDESDEEEGGGAEEEERMEEEEDEED